MKPFEEIRLLVRNKYGKILVALSIGIFLLIMVMVYFATFSVCKNIYLQQINNYLEDIPVLVTSYRNELSMRSRIYEGDIQARAELGMKIYLDGKGASNAEQLALVRDTVSAESVTLLDEHRHILATTGIKSPETTFNACIEGMEPNMPHLELYSSSQDGEATEILDGKGFMLLPVPDSTNSLVFEFPCAAVLELHHLLQDWSSMLDQVLSNTDYMAFTKSGDEVNIYPVDAFSPSQLITLDKELDRIFENADNYQHIKNGNLTTSVKLLVNRYLAVLTHYAQEDTDIMLTISLKKLIINTIFISVSISLIIGLGMFLTLVYASRRLLLKKAENSTITLTPQSVRKTLWPGVALLLVVALVFSTMLLMLENRSFTTSTAATGRESLEHSILWRQSQEKSIHDIYANFYLARAQTLATFLKNHPENQTQTGLEEINRIARSEYVMLFDKDGHERISSNSYIGFSVGENLSEDYRAVIMGYPTAVVGPSADPYTGEMQIGTAVLMTDSLGQPDGFLLTVYSAGDLSKELKRMQPETTVNDSTVPEGQFAAILSHENGCFVAHTDPTMIGLEAKDFLQSDLSGDHFEGFTYYKGKSVYLTARRMGDQSLLYMVPEHGDSYLRSIATMIALGLLVIMLVLYLPTASILLSRAMMSVTEPVPSPDRKKKLWLVFVHGYDNFLILFAIFALIASANGWWTSFDYVFSRQWSKGVHLFSLWAAMFVLVITLFIHSLFMALMNYLETRLSLHGKTITRLVKSFFTYATTIFLAFVVLDMLGVNTKALVTSAGIITIAVGMGTQSMAADLLAGFFMMLEGTIHVGDRVQMTIDRNLTTGRITDMGIRTTEITDDEGNVLIVNNSKLSGIKNMSRKDLQEQEDSDITTQS